MSKSQILGAIIILIIVAAGIVYFVNKGELPGIISSEQEPSESQEQGAAAPRVLSMAGIVSEVNAQANYLVVFSPEDEQKKIKLVISEETEIIKLDFPFDIANPPEETTFTPTQTNIEIKDVRQGNNLLIETETSLSGKTEINDVIRIQILP